MKNDGGGSFEADNWEIRLMRNIGQDTGEVISYGKNLQGIKIFEDWSSVVTKLYPVGFDGIMLPEKFLESEIQYETPHTKTISFETKLEEGNKTEQNLLQELRSNAINFLAENQLPKISYEVVSDINQKVEIGDKIQVKHPLVIIITEVLEYEYDTISKKIKKLIFGNFTRDVKTKFDNLKENITNVVKKVSNQEAAIQKQTDIINLLNKLGYIYIDDNEILVLDAIPKSKSKNVLRIGLGGIGFSDVGYEGPFKTAWTLDGKFNADFVTAGVMSVDRIEGLSSQLSLIVSETNIVKQTAGTANNNANKALDAITIKDTRGTNELPVWYRTNYPFFSVSEFKKRTAIGVVGNAMFGTLETTVQLGDTSGGPITQRFTSTDGIFERMGNATDTEWGVWKNLEGYIKNYIGSRGENLVTNGTGLMEDNTNFSKFDFLTSDAYGAAGSFRAKSIGYYTLTDELIPINPDETYLYSFYIKANPCDNIAKGLGALACYDVDKKLIDPRCCLYIADTLTTLAKDLNNGDKVIYLTSAQNWLGRVATGEEHKRSIITWDYTNSGGYLYKPLTYSQNYYSDIWDNGAIDYTNSTITLRNPWTGGKKVAGTQLSNSQSGNSLKYCTNYLNTLAPAEWTRFKGTIGGTGTDKKQFYHGTAYVNVGWITRDSTTSKSWFSNISFGLYVASQETLDDIANDNKLTADEKQAIKKEFDIIVSEKTLLEAQADYFRADKTVYINTYNALNTYITPLLANLTTTSDIVGDTFRAKFKDYYTAKTNLSNAISLKIDSKAEEQINSVQETLSASIKLTKDEILSKVSEAITLSKKTTGIYRVKLVGAGEGNSYIKKLVIKGEIHKDFSIVSESLALRAISDIHMSKDLTHINDVYDEFIVEDGNATVIRKIGEYPNTLDNSKCKIGSIDISGKEVMLEEYLRSDYTEITHNTEYKITVDTSKQLNFNRIFFFDANKVLLSRFDATYANEVTFTTPNNCKYIRVVACDINSTYIEGPWNYDIHLNKVVENSGKYILDVATVEDLGKLFIETFKKDTDIYVANSNSDVLFDCEYIVDNNFSEAFATKAEMNSSISQTSESINSEVKKKVGKNETISSINQTAEQIKIKANKIAFEGTVTANNGFKIDGQGNMEANNGKFNGGKIELNDNGTAEGAMFKINSNLDSDYAYVTTKQIFVGNSNDKISILEKDNLSVGNKFTVSNYAGMHYTNDLGNSQFSVDDDMCFVRNLKYINSSPYSIKEIKTGINKVDSILDKINNADICRYKLKEYPKMKEKIGLIISADGDYNTPNEVLNDDGDGIDLYSMISLAWKAIQELNFKIERLENRRDKKI